MTKAPKQSPLEPSPVVGAHSGWLAPDGTFFACESWEHEDMAWRLADRYGYHDHYNAGRALEEHEWIKLKSGSWIVIVREDATQRQLDALFDWATARGETLGDVFMDEERVPVTRLKVPGGGL